MTDWRALAWRGTAPPPTDEEVDAFECARGVRLTDEHRWFLQNVANGGLPAIALRVPTTDCEGGAAALHGMYGIGHPEPIYELGWALEMAERWVPRSTRRYVPFGCDSCGGQLMIDLERGGCVVYNPRDPDEACFSASSIRDFLETLEPEEEDEPDSGEAE